MVLIATTTTPGMTPMSSPEPPGTGSAQSADEFAEMFDKIMELDAKASQPHLDLGRAPYAMYGVKYISLVSPVAHHQTHRPANHTLTWAMHHTVCMRLNMDLVSLMVTCSQ